MQHDGTAYRGAIERRWGGERGGRTCRRLCQAATVGRGCGRGRLVRGQGWVVWGRSGAAGDAPLCSGDELHSHVARWSRNGVLFASVCPTLGGLYKLWTRVRWCLFMVRDRSCATARR